MKRKKGSQGDLKLKKLYTHTNYGKGVCISNVLGRVIHLCRSQDFHDAAVGIPLRYSVLLSAASANATLLWIFHFGNQPRYLT